MNIQFDDSIVIKDGDDESTIHEKELAQLRELAYELGYIPRPEDE